MSTDLAEICFARSVFFLEVGRDRWACRLNKIKKVERKWPLKSTTANDAINFGDLVKERRHEFFRQNLDREGRAVNSTSICAVLLAQRWVGHRDLTPSTQERSFVEPLKAHEHWHIDISYVNVCGTYYYVCSILDGYNRMIVHWDILEQMTEADVGPIIQRALEKHPGIHPRVILDSGLDYIAKDFKDFICSIESSLVRTSSCYPQSDGKNEERHRPINIDDIRIVSPLSVEDAHRIVEYFVLHYNTDRLHQTIEYVNSWNQLFAWEQTFFTGRNQRIQPVDGSRSQQPIFSM